MREILSLACPKTSGSRKHKFSFFLWCVCSFNLLYLFLEFESGTSLGLNEVVGWSILVSAPHDIGQAGSSCSLYHRIQAMKRSVFHQEIAHEKVWWRHGEEDTWGETTEVKKPKKYHWNICSIRFPSLVLSSQATWGWRSNEHGEIYLISSMPLGWTWIFMCDIERIEIHRRIWT
jgi:hypothetical protein